MKVQEPNVFLKNNIFKLKSYSNKIENLIINMDIAQLA